MFQLIFAPTFLRQIKKLDKKLIDEVCEKVELFKNPENHKSLKLHKLHGKLKNRFSFSVNYNTRVIFRYLPKNEVAILAVGNHNIYQ